MVLVVTSVVVMIMWILMVVIGVDELVAVCIVVR